jgi:hypothetical protein
MSSNYPPGVTGNELEIAGPDSEKEATEEVVCYNDDCALCGEEQEVEGEEWTYCGMIYFDWKCPSCGREEQYERRFDPMDYHPDL